MIFFKTETKKKDEIEKLGRIINKKNNVNELEIKKKKLKIRENIKKKIINFWRKLLKKKKVNKKKKKSGLAKKKKKKKKKQKRKYPPCNSKLCVDNCVLHTLEIKQ